METVAWRAADPTIDIAPQALPECEIRIVSYIDENGESMFCYSATNGMPISQGVGLLTMVSHALEHRVMDEDEDDE
jgi:hypothetical protein